MKIRHHNASIVNNSKRVESKDDEVSEIPAKEFKINIL
jgi:hypothetical protein